MPVVPERFLGISRPLAGWVLFEFGYVLLLTNVVTIYFPLWVVDDAGGRDVHFAIANGLAMAIVLVVAPAIGAESDRAGRRIPLLAALFGAGCLLSVGLGHGSLAVALPLFVIANAALQCASIPYDALLPIVGNDEQIGRPGGLGTAFGFFGALIGVIVGLTALALGANKPLVMSISAALAIVCAIPCFRWVREPRSPAGSPPKRVLDPRHTIRRARETPALARFLLGRLFYADASSTTIAFLTIYATKEIGFSETAAQIVILFGIVFGPAGALWAGRAIDRIGGRRTLARSLAAWGALLAIAVAIPLFHLPDLLFWTVAPIAGFAIGSLSTVDRAMVLRLAPPDRRGEMLGLYALGNRATTIAGPLMWALIVEVLDLGRPVAVAMLLAFVGVGYVAVRPVRDPAPALVSLAPELARGD